MKKVPIWISYDLSVRGDYHGIYEWLDDHDAKECGDSTAFLRYEYKSDFINEIKKDLSDNIDLSKRDRIYLIWMQDDEIRGRFLFGKRKASPWKGYGSKDSEFDEDF